MDPSTRQEQQTLLQLAQLTVPQIAKSAPAQMFVPREQLAKSAPVELFGPPIAKPGAAEPIDAAVRQAEELQEALMQGVTVYGASGAATLTANPWSAEDWSNAPAQWQGSQDWAGPQRKTSIDLFSCLLPVARQIWCHLSK